MAEILTFPARPKSTLTATDAAVPAMSAAILFFTGVRYERIAETGRVEGETKGTTPKPKKPRRRRRA